MRGKAFWFNMLREVHEELHKWPDSSVSDTARYQTLRQQHNKDLTEKLNIFYMNSEIQNI